MASPQKENGYTPIANELMERIYQLKLSGSVFRVILWIARDSYGWSRRKTGDYSNRYIARRLDMSESGIRLAFDILVEHKIIEKDDKNRWKINKNWETWSNGGNEVSAQDSAHLSDGKDGQLDAQDSGGVRRILRTSYPYNIKQVKIQASEEKDTKTATAPSRGTSIKSVMVAYKTAKGFAADDKAWDKANWSTWVRAAKKLLEAFPAPPGSVPFEATAYLADFGAKMDKLGRSWNLATVARWAWDDPAVRSKVQAEGEADQEYNGLRGSRNRAGLWDGES